MNNSLILVNEEDEEMGYCEKMDAHRKEYLHRAFSLFIYHKTDHKMLLHKRALGKYHSGGLWTNSCCSYPRYGENLMDAVIRRTKEELGLDISSYADELKEVGKFHYYKKYSTCAENEIDNTHTKHSIFTENACGHPPMRRWCRLPLQHSHNDRM